MRYLVKARVKAGHQKQLLDAIDNDTLGKGSIAGDEYQHDMEQARVDQSGVATWVETCFCDPPLEEERPYWEKYFKLLRVTDAHSRRNCRHENGTEAWACCDCDCTAKLEAKLQEQGEPFLKKLRSTVHS
jgi:hypothetical protein